jgi:integrase
MAKLVKHSTQYAGVRYYEHPKRKHKGKPDRYFSIRYRFNRKLKEEGLRWSSEGMTAAQAYEILAGLKKAKRLGEGPTSLSEKRRQEFKRKWDKFKENSRLKKEKITFDEVWQKYLPNQKPKVSPRSWKREASLYKLWIYPVIGATSMINVAEIDLQRIKKNMQDAGRSPRSICYCWDVIRQVFNYANRNNLIECKPPTQSIQKPRADNKRDRFLSVEESELLLNALKKKSQELYEIALISLHCGLRAGEIFGLKWSDVDLQNNRLNLRDTKGGRNRYPLMTDEVKNVFLSKEAGSPDNLVFPDRNGKVRNAISKSFSKTVDDLSLNSNCVDSRGKVVFHTLRHTFASWLVQSGVPIYQVAKHLGHSNVIITERYAHLAPHNFENSVKVIENKLKEHHENETDQSSKVK